MTAGAEQHLLTMLQNLTIRDAQINAPAMAALSKDDWDWVIRRANAHRLLPLLYVSMSRQQKMSEAPLDIQEHLSDAYRRAHFRQLRIGREIVLLHRILKQQNIPHMFLKGSVLSQAFYPQEMVRPMRDLDIIVPQGTERAAQECLLAQAGGAIDQYQHLSPSEAEGEKHLPPVWSPNCVIPVEVHSRLFGPGTLPNRADIDGYMADFWSRVGTFRIATETAPCPVTSDVLVHAICHGVYDHDLNVGPLVIHDIRNLVKSDDIEWHQVWNDLTRLQAVRGGVLLLQLAGLSQDHAAFSALPSDRSNISTNVPLDVINACHRLMLQDMDKRHDVRLAADLAEKSVGARLRFVLAKVFPNKQTILTRRTMRGQQAKSGVYPVLWMWFLWVRGQDFLRVNVFSSHSQPTTGAVTQLRKWLVSETVDGQ